MAKSLVIVESPAKAKTIAKYLGRDFIVESSIGHVRDLPSSADEIPAAYRGKAWSRVGVDIENDFEPLYIVPPNKKAQVQKLKDLLNDAAVLYLATDEDREGEAIAWHLREVLKPKIPVKRMVFHEITEAAIKGALQKPRDIDERLVDAQEARRILDRLYGYEVSPILWRKIAPRLSAGRVQSVATRLIVERERARMVFKSAQYFGVIATANDDGKNKIQAELVEWANKRVAKGSDFDPLTGIISPKDLEKVVLLDAQSSSSLVEWLKKTPLIVSDIQKKPWSQRPSPPFTTSTLQQESGRKLRYTAQRTMRIAQRLYENGYITYMRTDSTTLSAQALQAARNHIVDMYGESFVPPQPRFYQTKAKGAQEAHEAIRPAGEVFRTPESLRFELDDESLRLYDLIWKRTVASQMKDAIGERTTVKLKATSPRGEDAIFHTSGKTIQFAGFLRAYVEGSDDPDAELDEQERILPPLQLLQKLNVENVKAEEHHTQPPARFTEASLVKELEEKGIGRPSTYASIISTIQDRGYVFKKGTALVPTFTAFAVVNLLEQHFKELVDYRFTASMENDLDAISEGEKKAVPWLKHFYFGNHGKERSNDMAKGKDAPLDSVGLKEKITMGVDDIDPRAICEVAVGKTQSGELIAVRVGRYGPYLQVGDSDKKANLPTTLAPDEINVHTAQELLKSAQNSNRVLGIDPVSGKNIYLKSGRFGPYVQKGEMELDAKKKRKGEKPQMASLWPDMTPSAVTLDDALFVLSFPKVLGMHPENAGTITIHDGKFGPYIVCEQDGTKDSRSLPEREMMRSLTIEQAVDLLAQPKVRGRNARGAPAALKVFGPSPTTKKNVEIRTGRFGMYVTDGQTNATIPSSVDSDALTMDAALDLLAARAQRMAENDGSTKKTSRKSRTRTTKKTSKKTSVKKKSVKKATVSKSSTMKTVVKKTTLKKVAPAKTAAKKVVTKSTVKKTATKKTAKKTAMKKAAKK